MLELRELDYVVRQVRPCIEGYISTPNGQAELALVVKEMQRIKLEKAKAAPSSEEAHRKELEGLGGGGKEGGDDDEDEDEDGDEKAKRAERAQQAYVRSIFDSFDASGDGTMDAAELKQLLAELLLPCSDRCTFSVPLPLNPRGDGYGNNTCSRALTVGCLLAPSIRQRG